MTDCGLELRSLQGQNGRMPKILARAARYWWASLWLLILVSRIDFKAAEVPAAYEPIPVKWETCQTCNGRGKVEAKRFWTGEPYEKECKPCHGSGRIVTRWRTGRLNNQG
jgi:hypothetical protein